ncbi:MAG: hypothetical protein EXR00_05915 [Alphaproteobacteria bacterium]|nr:hypothetical protein [Alphaproteobacteria bacterium]
MSNLLSLAAIFFSAILLYHFRARIIVPLRRFEQRNQARRAEELRAMMDGTAHYRQTMALAEEQFEAVGTIKIPDARTGELVTRFLFHGEQYATREDAEAARSAEVITKAREFYIDLDRNFLSRRGRRPETFTPPKS